MRASDSLAGWSTAWLIYRPMRRPFQLFFSSFLLVVRSLHAPFHLLHPFSLHFIFTDAINTPSLRPGCNTHLRFIIIFFTLFSLISAWVLLLQSYLGVHRWWWWSSLMRVTFWQPWKISDGCSILLFLFLLLVHAICICRRRFQTLLRPHGLASNMDPSNTK